MEQSISENDVINKLKDKLVGSGWEENQTEEWTKK